MGDWATKELLKTQLKNKQNHIKAVKKKAAKHKAAKGKGKATATDEDSIDDWGRYESVGDAGKKGNGNSKGVGEKEDSEKEF